MTGFPSKKTITLALFPLLLLVMFIIFIRMVNSGGYASVTAGPTTKLRFDPDREKDSVNYDQLAKIAGSVPDARRRYRIGAVLKFFGNRYWQLMADGMQFRADELKMEIDVRAAASESDPDGQLAILEEMIGKGYDALLLSPQTDINLLRAVRKAREAGILIINVNDAVLEDAEHWVGPNQYENGVSAAGYFIRSMPQGGKVAVIRGLEGVYSVKQRTRGFTDTLKGTGIEVVANTDCCWDLQAALKAASQIIHNHPDVKRFYCNNDIMALGVVEAVRKAGRMGEIMVVGTDGIDSAYDSIRSGELTATVDTFPFSTGQVAMEVALRLLEGQRVPRAVYSPQQFISLENSVNHLQ